MPRDSNGNYTLPSGNPVVAGSVISSSGWGNPTMNDLASAITNSLSRNGEGGMNVPFKFLNGTAAAPAITFTSQPNAGLFRAASDDVEMSIAGVPRMRWTGTGIDVWDTLTSAWYALVNASGPNWLLPSGGTIPGPFTFGDNLTVTLNLTVGGDASIGDDLHVIGDLTVDGSSVLGNTTLRNALPILAWYETDGALDNKIWRMYANAEAFTFDIVDDAAVGGANVLKVERTGIVVDSIQLTAAAILLTTPMVTAERYSAVNAAGAVVTNEFYGMRTGAGSATAGGNTNIQLSNGTENTHCMLQKEPGGGVQFMTNTGLGWTERARIQAAGGFNLYAGGSLALFNTGNSATKQIYMDASDELAIYGTAARGGIVHNNDSADTGGRVILSTSAASGTSYLNGDLWFQYT